MSSNRQFASNGVKPVIVITGLHLVHLIDRLCGSRYAAQKHLIPREISSTDLSFEFRQRNALNLKSLHSSLVIPSSVSDSSYMSAPCWTCVDECRSGRSLACGVGFPTGIASEALDESIKRRSSFEAA